MDVDSRSIEDILEGYASKFLADDHDTNDLSDAALENAFKYCVISPKKVFYPAIRESIIKLAKNHNHTPPVG